MDSFGSWAQLCSARFRSGSAVEAEQQSSSSSHLSCRCQNRKQKCVFSSQESSEASLDLNLFFSCCPLEKCYFQCQHKYNSFSHEIHCFHVNFISRLKFFIFKNTKNHVYLSHSTISRDEFTYSISNYMTSENQILTQISTI